MPKEKMLSRMLIRRLLTEFEKTGTVSDKRHGNPGGPRTSRTDDAIGVVETFVTKTPYISVRQTFAEMNAENTSISGVCRTLTTKYDRMLTPYKLF